MRQSIFVLLSLSPIPLLLAQATGGEWELLGKLLQPGNLAASTLLVFIVIAFLRRWIVPGWLYDEVKARAERMEERAMKGMEITKQAVNVAEKTMVGGAKDGKDDPR